MTKIRRKLEDMKNKDFLDCDVMLLLTKFERILFI